MCGIAGFYTSRSAFSYDELVAMTTVIAHRGPDAAGYYHDGYAGMGQRRLSILDLSEVANQPMYSDDGRYVIIFNGEIYNYREMREKLIPEQQLKTTSDTEVILYSFIKLGPAFVHEMNGMFAIVIWDKQEQKMWMFRDRMGIKPIYYYWDGSSFAFASELKSILQLGQVRREKSLNPTSIANYLYLGYIPEPDSIYLNVKKFPSGNYAEISQGKLEIKPYWQLKDKLKSNVLDNYEEAKQQLKSLMESSVKYRLISDVPYGTFLSGGTDSTVVTAIAQHVSDKPVKTFSIAFDDVKHNEAPFAKKVAEYLKTEHYELKATEKQAQQLIPELINVYDEPMADSSALPTMLVSKLAREYVTMTLSGDGGDELFMGYGMYNWANRLNNGFMRSFRLPLRTIAHTLPYKYTKVANMVKYSYVKNIKSHIFSQEQMLFSETELYHLLTPEYVTPVEINEQFFDLPRKLSSREEQAYFDMHYYLKDDLLVKVDRASMRYGLEVRVPLLDYRVVEFSLNLSEKLKINNNIQKYLLKQVLYDYVPQSYFERPKWGFSIPLDKWLSGELHYLIDEYLSEEKLKKTRVLRPEIVKMLINDFNNGKHFDYNKIWQLILLQMFLLKEHV